jgi:hypothetical protein
VVSISDISTVLDIVKELNPSHSAAVEIDNSNGPELKMVSGSDSCSHGGWTNFPPEEIPAGTKSASFLATSAAGSVGTGVEGVVTYKTPDDAQWTIHFDNPFIGENSSDQQLSGDNVGNYKGNAETGNGNQAHFRFTLEGTPKKEPDPSAEDE